MTRKRLRFTAQARLVVVSLPILAYQGAAGASTTFVPIDFRTVSGIRPFVAVQINGTSFEFMVHSNASFYSMTTHANAEHAGSVDRRQHEEVRYFGDGAGQQAGPRRGNGGRTEGR